MFGSTTRSAEVKLARACLDCGTVSLCLGDAELQELRRSAAHFVPLP